MVEERVDDEDASGNETEVSTEQEGEEVLAVKAGDVVAYYRFLAMMSLLQEEGSLPDP